MLVGGVVSTGTAVVSGYVSVVVGSGSGSEVVVVVGTVDSTTGSVVVVV